MTEVDRYDMIVSNAGNYMEIRSDGDWVEFDDYERLEAINAELLAACKSVVRHEAMSFQNCQAAIANAQPQGE